jgi:hypothetical protein
MNTTRVVAALSSCAALVVAAGSLAGAQAPDEIKLEQTLVKADDGERTEGMLYYIPSKHPTTVIVTMHPNDDRQRHYMLRPAAERGFAGYGMKSRWAGEHGIHEEMLLDIAAAVAARSSRSTRVRRRCRQSSDTRRRPPAIRRISASTR